MAYPRSSTLSYEKLCLEVAESLTPGDIKKIIFFLRNDIKKAVSERIVDGKDLIKVLEEREYFCRNNVEKLEKLFDQVELSSLATLIRNYREGYNLFDITESPDSFTEFSMITVHNFVETENFRKMEKLLQTKEEKSALLKGPPGSGKSQNAFHFAKKFSRSNHKSIVWRINCKSYRDMHFSFASLMLKLGIRETVRYKEQCILECLQEMFKFIFCQLTKGDHLSSNHLFIMDDMESHNSTPEVHNMLEHLIIARNIYVIATSQHRYSPMLTHKYGMDIEKMADDEVIQLFKRDLNRSNYNLDDKDEQDIKLLANEMDHLPLSLALASSYINITKVSISDYTKYWSKLQEDAHEISTDGKSFNASFVLTLEKLDHELSDTCKKLLDYIPHLNYGLIHVQILESLLESESSTSIAADLNKFLAVLHDFSIATINGEGNNRIVSVHSITVWFLDKQKQKIDRQKERLKLLKHFCHYIDTDARLLETVNRNVKFLDHACCLLKCLEENANTDCTETLIFECYLCCCVAVTFLIYGNTQLSADHFFKKAKRYLFGLLSWNEIDHIDNNDNDQYSKVETFLSGNDTIKTSSSQLFEALLKKSKEIPLQSIKSFVVHKHRSGRDMRLVRQYGKFAESEKTGHHIPETCLESLTEQKVLIPLQNIQEIFLAELFVTIMYNHSKNIVFIEEGKQSTFAEDIQSGYQSSSKYASKALEQFQYAYNVSYLLEKHLKNIQPTLHSGQYTMTKRGGIYHFLKQTNNTDVLQDIIRVMDNMYDSCERERFYNFGILKMCKSFNLYQRCMIQNILRSCYSRLSLMDPSRQGDHTSKALKHCTNVESILLEMDPWIALTNVHLDIAETFTAVGRPDVEKARRHYELALRKQELPTRYKIKAFRCFIKFCKAQGTNEDYKTAEYFANEILRKSTKTEQINFMMESIDKLKRITRSSENREASVPMRSDDGDTESRTFKSVGVQCHNEPIFLTGQEDTGVQTGLIHQSLEHLKQIQQQLLTVNKERLSVEKQRLEIEQERLNIERERIAIEKSKLKQ